MCHCTPTTSIYCAMPLYHANAQILALAPPLIAGGCWRWRAASARRSFLADVRRYGATLFNYVGNPLAYIMETPAQPDDADNPLRLAYGNEAPRQYIDAFAARFGCEVHRRLRRQRGRRRLLARPPATRRAASAARRA